MSEGTVTREDLDAKAIELGIENPDKLKNMEAVEEAIRDAEADPRFSRDEVLANARTLTGYSRHLMVGALHGVEQETFTRTQAKKLGAAFAKHEQEIA